jgi:putative FmdB family regulatory protein
MLASANGVVTGSGAVTIAVMPIYEFRCGACGKRFEALVDAGTDAVECRLCGAAGAQRAFSAPAAPMSLAKSGGERRKQERRNAELRRRTKADFKAKRARAREARKGGG